jgi:DNA-binding MarR family transcriptional regulator
MTKITPKPLKLAEHGLQQLLGYQLAQAAVVTGRSFARSAGASLNLSKVEFTIVYLIHKNERVTSSLLARTLNVTMPAVTSWMRKLEKRGWVIRTPSESDLRSQYFELTDSARERVEIGFELIVQADAKALASLSPKQTATLFELLHILSHPKGPKPPEC